ncbi:MAG TPA: methyltransferase [Steroidobacteraceae bacterium]|nr:methyltransferase [Steroidobacteraceae bacterium]
MSLRDNEQLSQMVLNTLHAKAVCIVANLGIADQIPLGAAKSAAEVAQATGCHAPSLYRMLRLLASHGVFKETSAGTFEHTPLSAALRADAEGSFHAGAKLFHQVFEIFDKLDHTVQTGESGMVKVFGMSMFEYLKDKPQLAALFDAGMTSFHGYETGAMLDAYDFSGISVLADLGGGNGSLLAGVLRRYPRMRGILFDMDHVVARAGQSAHIQAVAERCTSVAGSFFETAPSGADAYLMRHVLHDWTDEQCVSILRNVRRVVPQQGRLLIVECVVPPGNERSISKDYDILMMVGPQGLERTEAQFRSLFQQSGFEVTGITPTSSMISVIEAAPAAR